VKRKAQLEEQRRNHQLQIEREELERQQKIEQARVDRLLDDAQSLRRATDIRAYVAAVRAIVANETASISVEEMQRWLAIGAPDRQPFLPLPRLRFAPSLVNSQSIASVGFTEAAIAAKKAL
jgi:hypothetical protein